MTEKEMENSAIEAITYLLDHEFDRGYVDEWKIGEITDIEDNVIYLTVELPKHSLFFRITVDSEIKNPINHKIEIEYPDICYEEVSWFDHSTKHIWILLFYNTLEMVDRYEDRCNRK